MCLIHFRLAVYYWIAVYTLGINDDNIPGERSLCTGECVSHGC